MRRCVTYSRSLTLSFSSDVLHDGVWERVSPNTLPVARRVGVIKASHRAGLRSTSTVTFGPIEEHWELAEHMRVMRELERNGGFTEFVSLSFISVHTLLARTHGVEALSHEENLKRAAVFRLALGTNATNLQARWIEIGLDVATEALRLGVNDLGGTSLRESIGRMARNYAGLKLDPPRLIAAAHAAAERTTLCDIRQSHLIPQVIRA